MSNADWIVLSLGAAGIGLQAVTGYVIVRVAVAVLQERMNGHKEKVAEQFKAQDEKLETHDREITRLRDWRHDVVAPALQSLDGRVAAIEERVEEYPHRRDS